MSTHRFALVGSIKGIASGEARRLLERGRATDPTVAADVARIIEDVRARGDDALRDLARRFDGAELDTLEVPRARWDEALTGLDAGVRAALEQAAAAIETFHRAQLPAAIEIETQPGVRLGRRSEPLRRVGVYAPGGRAAYPSSVLMGIVPARVAGVAEVVLCSPPDTRGLPPATVLAAAAIAGADRVFAIGGAGAIAALAFGSDSVPAVDRVVGPGNAWVTEAKQQLTRYVAIDCPAGPSEVLVLADETADADVIAAELLAQAEHDPDAGCVLVATSPALIDAVVGIVEERLRGEPRADIITRAFASGGALLRADDIDEAVEFAERYAPEHLLVLTREPRALLPRLRAAGTVFLGRPSSVAFGDYMTGANHVLPTAGLARAYSGLSTLDFLRFSTWQEIDDDAAAALAGPTATLADAEGLPAHARAARLRADDAGAERAAARPPAVPVRAAYRGLTTYDPGRAPCAVDLSDNTNLWGPHPAAAAAVRGAGAADLTRYPSVYATELKRALAARLDVAPENIVTGCGSDDVIDSALRAFCDPCATVAYPDPTFGMVSAFTRMNAARPLPVPVGADFSTDVDELIATRAAATYVCRPNNPSGTLAPRVVIEQLDAHGAGINLVDEAYIDFAGEPGLVKWSAASSRTIVLRTLSKAYGLAGLRVGFASGPAALVAEIEKSRGPYKVSSVAEAAALAILSGDRGWVAERVVQAIANRARLEERIAALGMRVWPSATNFLLVSLPAGASATDWNVRLRARGVAVRPFPALPVAGEAIRVTVGPWPQMERFLEAAAALLEDAAHEATR